MNRDGILRGALWASVPLNLGAGYLVAFPSSSFGQLVGLPSEVSPIYTTLLSFFILLFGGSYAWLARQPVIDRPLVALAAIGKAGVFVAIIGLWSAGEAPARGVLAGASDLALAAIFAWWLLGHRHVGGPVRPNRVP